MFYMQCIERIIVWNTIGCDMCVVCTLYGVYGVPNDRMPINQVNRKTSFIKKKHTQHTPFLLQCNNIYNEEKLYNKLLYASKCMDGCLFVWHNEKKRENFCYVRFHMCL